MLFAVSLILASCAQTPVPSVPTTTAFAPTAHPRKGGTPQAPGGGTVPATPPADLSSIKHVFVIVMENHGYSQVFDTKSSPYITSLAKQYAYATNYHAMIHPSLPNYLQMVSGSNYNITNDCSPSADCHVNAPNLPDSLDAKGLSWRAYMESMPTPCAQTESGNYAPRHDPFVYFDDIRNNTVRCATHVVPFTALTADLATTVTTPNFAFIAPDVCNDMHDCGVATGDAWLQSNVPTILKSPACTADKCLVIVTWDEDEHGEGNRVLTIFAGSGAQTGGFASSAAYTHYSLLRTIEAIFGLPAMTSNDAAAAPMFDMIK